jgi:hypothetical protein
MGFSDDDFQIKLGITEEGARGGPKSGSGSDFAPTVGAGREPVGSGRESKIDNRIEHVFKHKVVEHPLKGILRYAIAEEMTNGFQSLIPPADQNAFSEAGKLVSDLGANVGIRSLFLHSLKGGAVIGTMMTAIQFIHGKIEEISSRVDKEEEAQKKLSEKITEDNARIETALRAQGDVTADQIKEIEEKLFAREIA